MYVRFNYKNNSNDEESSLLFIPDTIKGLFPTAELKVGNTKLGNEKTIKVLADGTEANINLDIFKNQVNQSVYEILEGALNKKPDVYLGSENIQATVSPSFIDFKL